MEYLSENKIDIILKYVELLCPNIRKTKYTARYYLGHIMNVLNEFKTWKSLTKSDSIKKDKKYHYKTIADVYRLWCNNDVFVHAYDEIVHTDSNILNAEKQIMDLLIDSTLIINKGGVEGIGYGSDSKKKKFTKLTMLSNRNGQNVAVVSHTSSPKMKTFTKPIYKFNINKIISLDDFKPISPSTTTFNIDKDIDVIKLLNENGLTRTYKIKTLSHDIEGIELVVDSLNKPEIKKEITGDKGYIINEAKIAKLKEKNVTIIAPKRKNQNTVNTLTEKEKLKGRYKVENMLCKIKVFQRVHVRQDKKLKNYMGFVYLACICKS